MLIPFRTYRSSDLYDAHDRGINNISRHSLFVFLITSNKTGIATVGTEKWNLFLKPEAIYNWESVSGRSIALIFLTVWCSRYLVDAFTDFVFVVDELLHDVVALVVLEGSLPDSFTSSSKIMRE